MTDTARISLEVDELLTLEFEAGETAQVFEQAMAVYQRSLTLVEIAYGADSLQIRQLRDSIAEAQKSYSFEHGIRTYFWPVVRGTLKGLQRDVQAGLIGNLQLRGAGTSLGDLLTLAKDALGDSAAGSNDVAAVLTAAAFEDTIRRIGETLAAVQGRPKLEKVITALKSKSVLTGPSVTTALGYLKFRNDALHADWEHIDQAVTGSCLAFVEHLLLQHFS